MLLALTASVASAGPGLNLRWQACLGDGGTSNRTSTCLSSVGFAGTLVGSFVLPGNIAGVTGIEVVLDLTSAGTALPAWWAFGTGGCRAGSLGANGLNSPTATCIDWAHGAGAGGFAGYQVGLGGPNTARVKLGFAVATPTNLLGAIEYFGFNALISNVRTTGATACAGCLTPVCLVFNSVNVVPGTNAGVVIFGPTNLTDSNFAVWQGGGGVGGPGGQGCPAATPTRKATWDSVKSLYR